MTVDFPKGSQKPPAGDPTKKNENRGDNLGWELGGVAI